MADLAGGTTVTTDLEYPHARKLKVDYDPFGRANVFESEGPIDASTWGDINQVIRTYDGFGQFLRE